MNKLPKEEDEGWDSPVSPPYTPLTPSTSPPTPISPEPTSPIQQKKKNKKHKKQKTTSTKDDIKHAKREIRTFGGSQVKLQPEMEPKLQLQKLTNLNPNHYSAVTISIDTLIQLTQLNACRQLFSNTCL